MSSNRFDDLFNEADDAFDQEYGEAISQLSGLTEEQLKQVTPDGHSSQDYQKLISAVKQAEKENLSKAELKKNIEELGKTAVKIAKMVPRLTTLF